MRIIETGPRRVVLRANRETLALVAAASIVTLALAHSVHSRPDEVQVASAVSTEPQKDWIGHLTEVAAGPSTPAVEPLSSASLVVPKAQLALPQPLAAASPAAAPTSMKARACDSATCTKVAAAPTPARRRLAGDETVSAPPVQKERSLLSRLNPLNHMPDVSTLGRPFAYAGDAISGWVRRF